MRATLASALALGEVDLADPEAAVRALNQVTSRFGGLDGLVNVAGTFRWETLEQGSLDTWDLLYRVNLRSAVSTSRAALPHLLKRGGGRIVNIGAGAAAKAGAGMGAYAASKAGVAKLTEALAEELKDKGVTVNAILPSIIDTPANRADMPTADFTPLGDAAGDRQRHRVPAVRPRECSDGRRDSGAWARMSAPLKGRQRPKAADIAHAPLNSSCRSNDRLSWSR